MKITRTIATLLSFTLLASAASGAEREVLQVDWKHFQERVGAMRLSGRAAQITLSGGKKTKGTVFEVTDESLVLQSGHGTRSILKEEVAAVQFSGRMGNKGRIIGTAVGLGAGTAIGMGGLSAGRDFTEGPLAIAVPAGAAAIVLLGGVLGYAIGRDRDRQAPEFVLVH